MSELHFQNRLLKVLIILFFTPISHFCPILVIHHFATKLLLQNCVLYLIIFQRLKFPTLTLIWLCAFHLNICRAKSLRSTSNIFVINLAVADFFMMSKAPIFIYNSFEGGAFGLGKIWCQVYGVVGGYTGLVQATTNACIAYDRYKSVRHTKRAIC